MKRTLHPAHPAHPAAHLAPLPAQGGPAVANGGNACNGGRGGNGGSAPDCDQPEGPPRERRSIKELYGCLEGLRSGPPLTIDEIRDAAADGAVDAYLASVS